VVKDNGEYFLVTSYLENECDLKAIGTNSAILIASSSSPKGPFKYRETVLKATHYNAHLTRDPSSGKFVLFADGKDLTLDSVHDCKTANHHVKKGNTTTNDKKLWVYGHAPHDQITIATSSKLIGGTWSKEIAIKTDLLAGALCNRTSASPLILKNGNMLVTAEAAFCDKHNICTSHKATTAHCAKHVVMFESQRETAQSSTTFVMGKRILALEGAQHPFLWQGRRGFHILAQSNKVCDAHGCGIIASALNASFDWRVANGVAYDNTVQWLSGARESLSNRERPSILFDVDGITPLFLYNGVQRQNQSDLVYTLAIPFNVPQNAYLRPAGYVSQTGDSPQPYSTQIHAGEDAAMQNLTRLVIFVVILGSIGFVWVQVRRRLAAEVRGYRELERRG